MADAREKSYFYRVLSWPMSRYHLYDDDCLAALLQEGNGEAFDAIYHRYHAALYRNILSVTKDAAAAEDLVQDTFIAFWQKRGSIDGKRSLAGWLFVISYNLSVNWLKRRTVHAKAVEYLATLAPDPGETAGEYEPQMALVEQAIAQLPAQKKRVLELCKLEGRSYAAAAREMNISSHTVKEYLSLAMKSVRKYAASGYKFVLLWFLLS